MTFRLPFLRPATPTPLFLLSFLLATASANKYLPPSVILEQKNDAQQVLLIQVTASAPSGVVLQSECGTDTFYTTSAVVLGVNRTVDPTATALGAQTEGRVMERCASLLEFRTFERAWIPGCEAYADPGRREEGACGYAYLTPGMEDTDPYALAVTGAGGFEEVDGAVCRAAAERHCPEHVYVPKDDAREDEGGDGPAGGSGDGDEGGNGPASGSGDEGDSGNAGDAAGDGSVGGGDEEEGGESTTNDAVHSNLGRHILTGLLTVVAFWRIWV